MPKREEAIVDEEARTESDRPVQLCPQLRRISGRARQGPPHDATHPEAPVDFLSFHAIELYLKAFLRAKGLTVKQVKAVGHDLTGLRDKARDLGLAIMDENGVIDLAAASMMERRYIRAGFKQRHPHPLVFEVCRRPHRAAGDELRGLGMAKRLPSIESLA